MLVDEKVTVSHIELSSDCVWTANKWPGYDTETAFVSVVCFFDFDKSQRKKDTECSFIPENSISWESGQADISSKIPNKTGVSGENCGPCM